MQRIKSFFEKNKAKLSGIAFDMLAMPVAWVIVYWFKYAADGIVSHLLAKDALTALSILIIGQILCYFKFKVYRGLWHFASLNDVIRVMQATVMAVILSTPLLHFISIFEVVPRRVLPLYCLVLTAMLCGGRLVLRYWTEKRRSNTSANHIIQRVIIVGAGQAGAGLVRDLKRTLSY
ncbi:MAG TPA: polysaccharide biosynthesis protein, partial [Legionellaceae bacterium]|nr:polysaccharide biosynthesis protein [Legionellaceae bacterium]